MGQLKFVTDTDIKIAFWKGVVLGTCLGSTLIAVTLVVGALFVN